ncbi:MAG: hypothetical protein HY319_15580, partial [Armatimonadetes bacterium]|nr:hypothetical protein [Armatimonadota bacterium]
MTRGSRLLTRLPGTGAGSVIDGGISGRLPVFAVADAVVSLVVFRRTPSHRPALMPVPRTPAGTVSGVPVPRPAVSRHTVPRPAGGTVSGVSVTRPAVSRHTVPWLAGGTVSGVSVTRPAVSRHTVPWPADGTVAVPRTASGLVAVAKGWLAEGPFATPAGPLTLPGPAAGPDALERPAAPLHPHLHILMSDGVFMPEGDFYGYLDWDASRLTDLLRKSILAS